MWPFVTHTHVLILLYTHTHMHAHTIIVKIFILYFGGKRQTIIVCGGAGSSAIQYVHMCVAISPKCMRYRRSFFLSASFCFPFLGSNLFICHYTSSSPVLSRVVPRTHACPVSCGGCHNMGAMVCPATTRTHIHALNLQVKLGSLPEDIILPYGLHYNTRKYV